MTTTTDGKTAPAAGLPDRGLPVPVWRALAAARRLGWRLQAALRAALGRPASPAAGVAAALETRLRARLAAGQRPLRIGFVVVDSAKWSTESLFRSLAQDPDVTCGFVCALSDTGLRRSRAARRADHARQRAFFAASGPILADLYDCGRDRIRPLSVIDCDIVVIQQPWGMQDLPRRLAGRVLSAYVHYGFPVILNDRMQFGLPDFHPWLWRHVTQTEGHRQAMLEGRTGPDPASILVAGYPKLDIYRTPAPERTGVTVWPRAADAARRRVIFAPHHAMGAQSLGMATFDWSGPAMLALAQAHPEVDFILKPHPNLEHGLTRGGTLTATALAGWFADWRAAPNTGIVTGGHYFDLFRSSDALITDSGSFLAEYLPTGRPILRLVTDPPAALNAAGRALAEGFYTAGDAPALRETFARVVLHGEDPLAPLRRDLIDRVMPFAQPAADIVHDHLRQSLGLPVRPAIPGAAR